MRVNAAPRRNWVLVELSMLRVGADIICEYV
jgi:hypothetical protein